LSLTRFVPIAAALAVGILVALQARINGQLSTELDNGLQAALISFGSGLVLLSAMWLLSGRMRAGGRRMVLAVRQGTLPLWMILGGFLGGFFVTVQSTTVPMIGVAVFTVAVVAGQSAISLIVDRIGLGPAGKQPITVLRVAAAILAVGAVVLAIADRFGVGSTVTPLAVGFALVAGSAIAFQQAMNGRVSRASHSPFTAAWLNFAFGTVGLGIALGVAAVVTGHPIGELPSGPWWIYVGGVIGVVFIATSAWVLPIIGVLVFALVAIAGQLIGSLLLDVVFPVPGSNVTWNLIAGVLLALVAVVLATRRR
jgi:transporter family-2 protein